MKSCLTKNEKISLILAVCVLQILLLTGCGRIYDLFVINNPEENEVVTGSPEADSTEESSADVQKEESVPPKIYWTLPVRDYEVFLQDGAEETLIYHFDGEKVLAGSGRDLLKEEYDDSGPDSIGTKYLPEKNKILIRYRKDERKDFEEKEYDIDLEQIELYEFS